jgi:hypothetical protein
LILNGGAVTSEILSEVHVPTVGSFDGLANVRTAPEELWFVDNFNPQALRTSLFAGASLSPKSADGSFDMGIGGGLVSDGDVHFQVSFLASPDIAAGIQTITLNFGTDASVGAVAIGADGVHLPFSNDSYTLNMIPEPGTALLMGLGLAGLAAAGGRRRR